MADAADRAVAQQEVLDRHLLRCRPAYPRRTEPGTDCLSCGEEIPEARRSLLPGCCLCVDCQEDAERVMGR
ncbi:MAG TPA: TraR/DksA C4-type zinc finger protein [Gammaproteobacteria bacterium]|nr:TraR/DksA C4-type zinc finger protein [Gammaproteobacteria bacterium]